MADTPITPTVIALGLSGVASTLVVLAVPIVTRQEHGACWDIVWTGLLRGVVGGPVERAYRTASFEVSGTFGTGGSAQVEGSNGGGSFYKLTPAALTSAGLVPPLAAGESPRFFRPNVTAGDSTTALTVTARLD